MGKIVKFCSSCDEGFAEKFGFCPNCGQTLQTFEMSPVVPEAPVQKAVPPPPPPPIIETPAPVEVVQAAPVVEEPIIEEPVIEQPVIAQPVEVPVVAPPPAPKKKAAAAATVAPYVQKTVVDADAKRTSSDGWVNVSSEDDGGFHITQIQEKNVGTRRALLVGSFGFMVFVLMSAMVYNLFSKDLEVGSINDDIFNAVMVEDVPTEVEEQEVKLNKDKGGGGGGGGREEKEETSQGDLADQSPKPIRPPDVKIPRLDNPELVLPKATTEGNRTFEKKFDRFGDPDGRFANFSNGTGSGGGQGSGVGTGQGSGRGTGAGSGTGSGSGGGLGSGNGNGTGGGDGDDGNPPPARPVGVTQGIKILSKPRPGYTDAARTANVQGTVILRVTFLASGQVGSVSVVKGLPNGLSEQAIAAAKRISFEPAKTNGQGQTVTKQIEYSFSIY
ncbi:MAG: energy transducer TonB [Pyrinomonadaceae bacterium]